jgi:RNA polymerase sigma-70 factor (sigma-E family)
MPDEPAGFRDFVDAHRRDLLRAAWLLTGDWQRAEDLVQTALAKTWPNWTRLRASGDDHLDAYVRRVLYTTYATWWRRRWRDEVPTSTLPDRSADGGSAAYDAADGRAALWPLVRRLPPRQRAVIVLRYFEDQSEAATAAALGCSIGTVKSQTAKALAHLRLTVDEPQPVSEAT